VSARIARILIPLLIGCAAAVPALASVRASLDASQIAAGDTVQLTLEHDGHTSGQPDVTSLQREFDILGSSSSTMFELINGSASLKTDVVLTLAPKVTGHLTIPPLSWDGEQSQPLTLDVTGPPGAGTGSTGSTGTGQPAAAPTEAKVFMETSASPQQPYVEAAVQLTIHLYMAETLYHADLDLPASSDFVVKRLGSDESAEAERNGQSYHVITRQYLLFPLRSGKLTLPAPVLDADVAVRQPAAIGGSPFGSVFGSSPFGGLLRTVRPVRLYGRQIVLSVRPRPASAIGSYWLPASEVTLDAAWNPAKLAAQTGEPVTLDLDLKATGLAAAQLPDLAPLLSLPAGLKAYPDQPRLDDSAPDGKLVGSRDQTIALMADSPGRYTIPALTVKWWDTRANQPRTATLPARTLTILPAPGSAAATASAPPVAAAQRPTPAASQHAPPPPGASKPASVRSSSEWQWISLGLAVVWLATLGAWLWSRRSRPAPATAPPTSALPGPSPLRPEPGKERAAFRAACEANDPHGARSHLLAWAAALWGTAPAGINAIAARVGDDAAAQLLRDLDRACYAGGAWQGGPLAAALTELPAPPGKTARRRDGLAPLYP
jgi:BatD DUF11 like domain